MTDRDRRLVRARAHLAVAFECLQSAECDLLALELPLGNTAYRLRRSTRWLCREIGRQLERKEAGDA
jgi:hypothetical protein